MKHVDVVIISWARNEELLKVTKDGLDSLFRSDSKDVAFHAYVIESNPEINYKEYDEKSWMHSCTTIHPEVPFGYHRYLNIGRRAGNSPYVVLCNSDLTYEKNPPAMVGLFHLIISVRLVRGYARTRNQSAQQVQVGKR